MADDPKKNPNPQQFDNPGNKEGQQHDQHQQDLPKRNPGRQGSEEENDLQEDKQRRAS